MTPLCQPHRRECPADALGQCFFDGLARGDVFCVVSPGRRIRNVTYKKSAKITQKC